MKFYGNLFENWKLLVVPFGNSTKEWESIDQYNLEGGEKYETGCIGIILMLIKNTLFDNGKSYIFIREWTNAWKVWKQ